MNGFPALLAVGLALGIAIAVKGVPPVATTASLFVASVKAEGGSRQSFPAAIGR